MHKAFGWILIAIALSGMIGSAKANCLECSLQSGGHGCKEVSSVQTISAFCGWVRNQAGCRTNHDQDIRACVKACDECRETEADKKREEKK